MNLWKDDPEKQFAIKEDVIKNYFNRTRSLVFDEESAKKEEQALLPYIHLPVNAKILDLGCANGRWMQILQNQCSKYVGVDISKNFIKDAKKRFRHNENIEFLCLPAEDYVGDEQFDLILIIGLITYMNDDAIRKMASHCKKMLKKGGMLIMRNVTLEDSGVKRKIYNNEPKTLFEKMLYYLGRFHSYQIIRRSKEEELSFFKNFTLTHMDRIQGTGYRFYVFS